MAKNFGQSFNIYFGTIGNNNLKVKYRFTKSFKNEEDAKKYAKSEATRFYYKNEGTHGLPSYDSISQESKITEIDLETLYAEHIEDMCRWYAIPTELDTIPSKKLKW